MYVLGLFDWTAGRSEGGRGCCKRKHTVLIDSPLPDQIRPDQVRSDQSFAGVSSKIPSEWPAPLQTASSGLPSSIRRMLSARSIIILGTKVHQF